MRAELVLMGRRVDMARRARRRGLLVAIYAGFAVFMTGFWFVDQWRTWTICAFALLLGLSLAIFGMLLKPFNGNERLWRYKEPQNSRIAKLIFPREPEVQDRWNDERELRRRDRAHYYAYRVLAFAMIPLSALVFSQRESVIQRQLYLESLLREDHVPNWPGAVAWLATASQKVDNLVMAVVICMFIVSALLPQTLILWNAPDMEEA